MKQNDFPNKIIRKNFSTNEELDLIPGLVSLQLESYEKFLAYKHPENSANSDLTKAFKSFFPMHNQDNTLTFDFVSYRIKKPKYHYKECLHTEKTYCAELYATLRLIVFDNSEGTSRKERNIKAMKEQEVFLCEMPLMTDIGSFIFNGIQRVVISQLRKAPGVFFDLEDSKISNNKIYTARIIPMNGSWIDFEFDSRDNIYMRIDKKRKLPATTFLTAMGISRDEYLTKFYKQFDLYFKDGKCVADFDYETNVKKFDFDIVNADTGEVVIAAGVKLNKRTLTKAKQSGLKKFYISEEFLPNYVLVEDIKSKDEIEIPKYTRLSTKTISRISELKYKSIKVINPDDSEIGNYIFETSNLTANETKESSLSIIMDVIRNSDNALAPERLEDGFKSIFFSNRYDLSEVGRMKINHRLGLKIADDVLHLTKEDIMSTIYTLAKIKHNEEPTDDIDSLANRRLRMVGELVDNQFRIGLSRIERIIKEKMNNYDPNAIMPKDLINHRPLDSAIKDFFATSQLSQFMDQTNPLSEISHKRRISALGPGGLVRERAGFDVRDIHFTQYGKICPIETPEGQNIGLVNNLSLFAQVDKYGFITTPYKKVENGIVKDEIIYLSAIDEADHVICGAAVNVDKNGKILDKTVTCRVGENFENRYPEDIEYIELSTRQIGSVSTNLIPFVESDDAKRSLLASNMMRQSVPFAKPEMPLVGTGLEAVVAENSGSVIKANKKGIVKYVDSSKIIVENDNKDDLSDIEVYKLDKYIKTNNDTSINQKPLVEIGEKVKEGQMITNSQCVDNGEMSIGKNTLIAFLPWDGYNHEDSIVVSERLIRDEVFTSIHIQEFEAIAKDTRLGAEEITRDIPNVSEEVLRKLDESGIIHIGAEVKPGDILVGKTSPKSETLLTPEEKLLKTIFGEKASDVKDTSLYLPQGVLGGVVIDVQVFNRPGLEKDERSVFLENQKVSKLLDTKKEVEKLLKENLFSKIFNLVENKEISKAVGDLKKGDKITKKLFDSLSESSILKIVIDDSKIMNKIEKLNNSYNEKLSEIGKKFDEDVAKIRESSGEELPQGALKIVKVVIATKQKLQAGDKMCGRHGNKGVVSKVLPIADMPYMEDGTPIDILLTPAGVPSRMNIGQILETYLGWASVGFGKQIGNILDTIKDKKEKEESLRNKLLLIYDKDKEKKLIENMNYDQLIDMCEKFRKGVPFATGTFAGTKIEDIEDVAVKAGLEKSGQVKLYDGRTGEVFERPVTVGYMYMLKLYHLVDTKIHARSIGPYSLITQQPLQGKSHFGGQRFGEMECWALQGYGAAYTLQEMLTVKSDDVLGRVKMYESIVRGDQNFTCGVPESFNVMIREVRSLGLNIELIKDE